MTDPSLGTVVTYLPDDYTIITVDGVTYYHYGNYYLQCCPGGYVVVPPPKVAPKVTDTVAKAVPTAPPDTTIKPIVKEQPAAVKPVTPPPAVK
jgi:hypothetical protein